jgi:hypothetical protein
MTEEKQRIAIAEFCGFIEEDNESEICWTRLEWTYCVHVDEIPDYLNDLNAMHEAEKVLNTSTDQNTTGSYAAYAQCLAWAGGYSATAAQRAEAFLRTIEKMGGQQ